jgi:hypothetical protein
MVAIKAISLAMPWRVRVVGSPPHFDESPLDLEGFRVPWEASKRVYITFDIFRWHLFCLKHFPDKIRERRCHLVGGIFSPRQFVNIPHMGVIFNIGHCLSSSFTIVGATMSIQLIVAPR